MVTGIAFLLVCLGIGYVGYWMITNDKADPDGAYGGLLGMRRPKPRPPERPPFEPRRR
jgi:hypothetical protein